jgi:hypothetical protein
MIRSSQLFYQEEITHYYKGVARTKNLQEQYIADFGILLFFFKNLVMKVLKFNLYRDGGTIEITTDEGVYCVDGRINSITKGDFFLRYPLSDNSNIIRDSKNLELRIIEALKNYEDHFFDKAIKGFIALRTDQNFGR